MGGMDGNEANRVPVEWVEEWVNADGGVKARLRRRIRNAFLYPIIGTFSMSFIVIGLAATGLAIMALTGRGEEALEMLGPLRDMDISKWSFRDLVEEFKGIAKFYLIVSLIIGVFSFYDEMASLYRCLAGRGMNGRKINGYEQ